MKFRARLAALALTIAFPALAQDIKLPPTVTLTAYDTGSSGFNIAVAIGKAIKDKHGTDVRVLPAGNDVARLQTKGIVTEMEDGNLDKELFSKKAADGSTYGDWYKKWIESPEPVKWVEDPATPGKTIPEVNAPRGMPEPRSREVHSLLDRPPL